jgi:hypothetical protein
MARLRHLVPLMLQCAVAFDVRQPPKTVRNRPRLSFLVQSEVPPAEKVRDSEGQLADEDSPRRSAHSVVDADGEEGCLPNKGLPPVLQSLVDERREYQLNLGRAMDTLRVDMQDILSRAPGSCFFRDESTCLDARAGFVVACVDGPRSRVSRLLFHRF